MAPSGPGSSHAATSAKGCDISAMSRRAIAACRARRSTSCTLAAGLMTSPHTARRRGAATASARGSVPGPCLRSPPPAVGGLTRATCGTSAVAAAVVVAVRRAAAAGDTAGTAIGGMNPWAVPSGPDGVLPRPASVGRCSGYAPGTVAAPLDSGCRLEGSASERAAAEEVTPAAAAVAPAVAAEAEAEGFGTPAGDVTSCMARVACMRPQVRGVTRESCGSWKRRCSWKKRPRCAGFHWDAGVVLRVACGS